MLSGLPKKPTKLKNEDSIAFFDFFQKKLEQALVILATPGQRGCISAGQ
jgi:hypothetical protein